MQPELDFTQWERLLHTRENNLESETILKNNETHLNNKCKQTLDLLQSGIKLTVWSALVDYGISSLPRRCKDLKEKGYDIKSKIINSRYKEYFIE